MRSRTISIGIVAVLFVLVLALTVSAGIAQTVASPDPAHSTAPDNLAETVERLDTGAAGSGRRFALDVVMSQASSNPLWPEAGAGSASGGGISNNSGESLLPSLATTPDSTPYVAWEDDSSGDSEIYVRRWNGSSWVEVGAGSASGGGISNNSGWSGSPSMAAAVGGALYVAWADKTGGDSEIYVRRWNGSSWEEVGAGSASGGGISDNSGGSYLGSIVIAPDGSPYVAWYDYTSGPTQVYVRRWNGSSWAEVGTGSARDGGISNTDGWAYNPSMAIAPDGTVYVAWHDDSTGAVEIYVRRWNGSSWVEVGAGSASGGGISNNGSLSVFPSVAVAPDGTPYVAWHDYNPGNPEIYVRRWNGSSWAEVGSGSASGGGISRNSGRSLEPALAIAPEGTPHVAWRDDTDGDHEIYVRRWSGSSWEEIGAGSASGGGLSANSGQSIGTSLAIAPNGAKTVAWHDDSAGDLEIYVRQAADLVPQGLEVTQAIQSMTNTVTLVEGKRTYARFHVQAHGVAFRGVGARLSATRGGQALGDALLPLNPNAAITVTTSPSRGALEDSFYFELPPAWLSGTVQLRAEVNPNQALAQSDFRNDAFTTTVTFEATPPLTVTLVGVIYAENNITYTTRLTDHENIASWLRMAYPAGQVNVITTTLELTGGLPTAVDLNQRLATMYAIDTGKADQCPGVRTYGLVDDGGGFMRGRAVGIPGCIASGPTGDIETWGWDFDGSYGDWYAAHELGHTLGRYHAEFCGALGGRPYPYPDGKIGDPAAEPDTFYGFNVEALEVYTPALWTDFMTYCDYQWVSDFTYEGLRSRLISERVQAAASASAGPASADGYLLVLGEMNLTQDTAEFGALYHLPDLTPSALPATSPYTLRLLDGTDGVLAEYPFTPKEDTEPQPGEDLMATLYEIVPYAAGTARIVVASEGVELASRPVSANPPEVTVLYPQGGETLAGQETVTWQGSDTDGDTLTYALLYSADDGATWTPVAAGLADLRYRLRTGELAGSYAGRLRVLASDGVNTAWDDSDGSFQVPYKAPVARIVSPETGQTYLDKQTVILAGEAFDREDGFLDGADLAWLSSLDGLLGLGRSVAVTRLTAGEHTLTLRATDSDRLTGTASITLNIYTWPRVYLPLVLRQSR